MPLRKQVAEIAFEKASVAVENLKNALENAKEANNFIESVKNDEKDKKIAVKKADNVDITLADAIFTLEKASAVFENANTGMDVLKNALENMNEPKVELKKSLKSIIRKGSIKIIDKNEFLDFSKSNLNLFVNYIDKGDDAGDEVEEEDDYDEDKDDTEIVIEIESFKANEPQISSIDFKNILTICYDSVNFEIASKTKEKFQNIINENGEEFQNIKEIKKNFQYIEGVEKDFQNILNLSKGFMNLWLMDLSIITISIE